MAQEKCCLLSWNFKCGILQQSFTFTQPDQPSSCNRAQDSGVVLCLVSQLFRRGEDYCPEGQMAAQSFCEWYDRLLCVGPCVEEAEGEGGCLHGREEGTERHVTGILRTLMLLHAARILGVFCLVSGRCSHLARLDTQSDFCWLSC